MTNSKQDDVPPSFNVEPGEVLTMLLYTSLVHSDWIYRDSEDGTGRLRVLEDWGDQQGY